MLQPPAIQTTVGRGINIRAAGCLDVQWLDVRSPITAAKGYSRIQAHLTKEFRSTRTHCEEANQHPCQEFNVQAPVKSDNACELPF